MSEESKTISENDTISIKARVLRLRKDDVEAQMDDGNFLRIHKDFVTIEHKAVLEAPDNKARKPGGK